MVVFGRHSDIGSSKINISAVIKARHFPPFFYESYKIFPLNAYLIYKPIVFVGKIVKYNEMILSHSEYQADRYLVYASSMGTVSG